MPKITCTIEILQADSPSKVLQNMQTWKCHVIRNDVIMMSLPRQSKTIGKFGPRRNQTKYISLERFWWELFKNVTFVEFEPLFQKLWAFLSNLPKQLTKYGHVTWLWLQIQKFLILLNSVLNFRKGYQFGGNWLKNKNVTGKKPIGEQKAPLPPQCL